MNKCVKKQKIRKQEGRDYVTENRKDTIDIDFFNERIKLSKPRTLVAKHVFMCRSTETRRKTC